VSRLRTARAASRSAGSCEDPALEPTEVLARLEAQLPEQARTRSPVHVERLGLPARSVEREHELGGEALAQRVLVDERLELRNELRVPALGQIAREAAFERRKPQFLEPLDLGLRERLECEIAQRGPAPQLERLAIALPLDQAHEAMEVELPRLHPQHIAGRPRLHPVGAEELPQARDVPVQRGRGSRRRGLAPELVDDPVLPDDFVRVQEQQPQERPLPPATERERPAVFGDLQRPQDPEVHSAFRR
jgi:hypothetical protein